MGLSFISSTPNRDFKSVYSRQKEIPDKIQRELQFCEIYSGVYEILRRMTASLIFIFDNMFSKITFKKTPMFNALV